MVFLSGCVQPDSFKTDVAVHFIPVGQGDSIFIDTPGRDVLIDGGDCGRGDGVVAYLHSLNVSRIDVVVASHHDSDHVCGLVPVLEAFDVLEVWDNGSDKTDTQVYARFLQAASGRRVGVEPGGSVELSPGVRVFVLSPLLPEEVSENDQSLVLKLVAGGARFLFMADCEHDCESGLLWGFQDVGADVLKVGHHGSKDATGPFFLWLVHPRLAVIPVGANQYGFPHPEVLDRLVEQGVQAYRTDRDGAVVIRTDGSGVRVG